MNDFVSAAEVGESIAFRPPTIAVGQQATHVQSEEIKEPQPLLHLHGEITDSHGFKTSAATSRTMFEKLDAASTRCRFLQCYTVSVNETPTGLRASNQRGPRGAEGKSTRIHELAIKLSQSIG